jgi:hypothetical protein
MPRTWTELTGIIWQHWLKAERKDSPAVIMIDEVHKNYSSSAWTTLLKSCKPNLIVLGVGIPQLNHVDSPHPFCEFCGTCILGARSFKW